MRKFSFVFKAFFSLFVTLTLFSFVSCEVGMGESVDLEAPTITLTEPHIVPAETTYLPQKCVLKGTCYDNREVTDILITYTYAENGKDITVEDRGTVNGNTWEATVTFTEDREVELSIIARDRRGNESEDSVVSFMAVIDASAPSPSNIFVAKNGNKRNFLSLDDAKKLNEKVSADKDDFQNEEFKISISTNDNYKVANSLLSLYDEFDNPIIEDLPADGYDSSSHNPYTPEWTIKESQITENHPEYKTGRHYFYPKFQINDAAKNRSIYSFGNYLCWYPESDRPKILYPTSNVSDGVDTIKIEASSPVPITVFDDDGIDEIYYGLVESSDLEYSGTKIDAEKTFTKKKLSLGNKIYSSSNKLDRDESPNVTTSSTDSGKKYLVVAVKDRKTIPEYAGGGVWNYSVIPVEIGNFKAPIIIVSTPQENTSPVLSNNKFPLEGYTLDDATVGKFAIAWLPDGETQKDYALGLLREFVKGSHSAGDSTTDSTTNIKIWKPTSNADGKISGYEKNKFSQSFNVLTDFKVDGKLKNESKFFIIFVIDASGNEVYKTYRLGNYTASPEIEVSYSGTSSGTYTAITDSMITYTEKSTGDLYFKVKPIGANGLEIDKNTLEITVNNVKVESTDITESDGVFSFSKKIPGTRMEISVEVKDVLGNAGLERKVIAFADKAILNDITTDSRKGSVLAGDELFTVQANFSGNVEFQGVTETNKPYIVLSNIKINGTAATDQKAVYDSGSGTDTIIFKYKVPEGATTDEFVGTPETSPITFPSGTSMNGDYKTPNKYDSIENSKIKFDAVPPELDLPNCNPKKHGLLKLGTDEITNITVAFNENIYMEGGTVTVQRTKTWAIPPVIDDDTFKNIYASLEDPNDKIKMIGTSTGEPELLAGTGVPKGPYKKITHGLDLSDITTNGVAKPDKNTKYVLDFDYDIFATTGVVQELREILENYGYHKMEFDISECTVSGKTITIPVPTEWFVYGREFEVTLTKGCVIDEVGNKNAAIDRGVYTFWTDKVATPWIIVDRYTHGEGVKEPNANGTFDTAYATPLTRQQAFNTTPTGYARVKVVCETPNAKIYYAKTKTSATLNLSSPPADRTGGEGKTNNIHLDDVKTSIVTELDPTTKYDGVFAVGDGNYMTSEKYYIKAIAKSESAYGTQPKMTEDSDAGYEGAFKTIIYSHNPTKDDISATNPIVVQGSNALGEPTIAGFPMRDANPDTRYERVMYKCSNANNGDYVIVSFEIVSEFRMQTKVTNWSKDGDTFEYCKYGYIIYNNGRNFHN